MCVASLAHLISSSTLIVRALDSHPKVVLVV